MADVVTPWWQAVDEAVESLVAALAAASARAAAHTGRKRSRGRSRPKQRGKSTRRHLAEVIRAHRLAPGVPADRDTIAALLTGHRGLVTNPVLVVAVAQACGIVAGRRLTAKEATRLRMASKRIAKLIARAEAADRSSLPIPALVETPAPVPVEAPTPTEEPLPLPVLVEAPTPTEEPVPLPVEAPVPVLVEAPAPMPVAAPAPVLVPVPGPAPVDSPPPVRRPHYWPWALVFAMLLIAALIAAILVTR